MAHDSTHEKKESKELLLEDEAGKKCKVIKYEETVYPTPYFKSEAEIQKQLSYVENLQYQDGDVFLCSYPKTGSHWITNLIHFLLYDGQLDEMVSYPPNFIDFFDVDTEFQREGRRIILSHFQPKRLPKEHFAKGGKTIIAFRNPKDTVVSMFYFLQRQRVFGDYSLSWNAVYNYWLEGILPFGSYFDYYNGWQEMLSQKPTLDVLIVQYEDLKLNGLNEVRRIQKYFGLNHSDERLEAVLKRCSLENLKKDVENGKIPSRNTYDNGKSVIFRKGVIGDWKNHFTVAQNEKFEAIVNEKLKNSIFSYELWN